MIKSFRLRLALLAALLAGVALLAFGGSVWWLVRTTKIERLDREVRAVAEREVSRVRSQAGWLEGEIRMDAAFAVPSGHDLLVLVQDGSGETLYRSGHWPRDLDDKQFAWPARAAERVSATQSRALAWSLVSAARAAEAAPGRAAEATVLAQAADDPRRDNDLARRLSPPGQGREAGERPFPPPRPPGEGEFVRPDRPADRPLCQGDGEGAGPGNGGDRDRPAVEDERTSERPPGRNPPVSALVIHQADGQRWHIGLAVTERQRIAVAVDELVVDGEMKGIRNAFLVALPFTLLLIGLGGWAFSTRALRPLDKLTAAAREVTAEGLDRRIAAEGEDREFVELISVFNRMLGRLERSFKQAHRFSADAAHELKTPLAILQGQLERAIQNAEAASAMQLELSGILDEVRRLSTISRKLLLLSQADAGQMKVFREPFDLSAALEDLVEDTRMLAPDLQVDSEIQPDLRIQADGALLRQVLHNLISNAIKYNTDPGWIRITTARWGGKVEVLVANASAGIPVSERNRIFERFYRADPAHGRQVEGVGLGLAVSREIVRAHGGDLELQGGRPEQEVCFSMTLPE